MEATLREEFDQVQADLTVQRQPWEPHWEDVATYLAPYRFRLWSGETMRGERKNQRIINGTGSLAHRTYKTGMQAHNTSAARPWLALSVEDQDLAEYGPVKSFTDTAANVLLDWFGRSNLYKNFPSFYGDQAGFSNAALWVEEDLEDLIRTDVFLCGQYYWGSSTGKRIDMCFRKFRMTVRQIVGTFLVDKRNPGKIHWDKASTHIKSMWDNKGKDQWVDIGHMVMVNPYYEPRLLGAKYKKYCSYYYELGTAQSASGYLQSGAEYGKFLSESGYDHFPLLAGRGETSGEDVYGIDGPGMLVIGDIRELQYHARKEGKGIDKVLDPPTVGPPELKGKEVWGVPGKFTPLAEREGMKGLRPIYQIDPRIDHLIMRSERIERRIEEAFFVHFFRMLSSRSSQSREMTATEIIKLSEEQIAQLEPTISANNYDVLGPLVDLGFDFALKQELLPPIPKELNGMRLKVEYISTMAMAMRQLALGGVERTTQFTLSIAEHNPQVMDKVDWDQAVDEVASRSGAPGRMIVPDEVVAKIREDRARQAQAPVQAESMERVAKTAKTLSETNTQDKNALTDITKALGGDEAAGAVTAA